MSERLAEGAPRAAILPELELRQWRDQLVTAIDGLQFVKRSICDAIWNTKEAEPEPTYCQLCGGRFGATVTAEGRNYTVVRLDGDPRFCQLCASGAAYRELRAKQAEAHVAERARKGDR